LNGHLPIVASGLRIAGWIIGAPSFLLTLYLGGGLFGFRQAPPTDVSAPLDIKTYGLIALLDNGVRGIARMFEFFACAAAWILTALTLVSLTSTLIGAMLYLVGRGVAHHATWARILAILIFLGLLPLALGSLSVLPRLLLPVGWLLVGAALYSLWVLVWRFNQVVNELTPR
jgi:hypothetical protein